MKKDEIYHFLKENGVKFSLNTHKAVFSMGELDGANLAYPDRQAKSIFLRDRKKESYYLITILGKKRVDLKEFSSKFGLKRLSFASKSELYEILNLTPGSVSPFGVLNDKDSQVEWFVDSEFFKDSGIIGIHPNDNTATIWLLTSDLVNIIKTHAKSVKTLDLK